MLFSCGLNNLEILIGCCWVPIENFGFNKSSIIPCGILGEENTFDRNDIMNIFKTIIKDLYFDAIVSGYDIIDNENAILLNIPDEIIEELKKLDKYKHKESNSTHGILYMIIPDESIDEIKKRIPIGTNIKAKYYYIEKIGN
jgi:hypothetical protein